MTKQKNIAKIEFGDEAPSVKGFLIVIGIFLLLIALSWIAYYKFGWLH